jgi:hypothetical protein
VIPRAHKKAAGFFFVFAIPIIPGGDMTRQSQNKFIKRQKEIERKRKSDEKMAKRRDKKANKPMDVDK